MCGRHFLVLFAYWFCECFHTLQYSDNLATFYIDFCVYLFLCIYAACLLLPFICAQIFSVANCAQVFSDFDQCLVCCLWQRSARCSKSDCRFGIDEDMAASAAVAASTAMELIEDMKQQMLAMQTDWAAQMSEVRATMTQEAQTREESVRTVDGMINVTIGRVGELETLRAAADYRLGILEARSGPAAGPPGISEKEESRLSEVVGVLESRVSSAAARADATFDKHAKRIQEIEEAMKTLKGAEETGGEQGLSQEPEPTAKTKTTEEEKEKEDNLSKLCLDYCAFVVVSVELALLHKKGVTLGVELASGLDHTGDIAELPPNARVGEGGVGEGAVQDVPEGLRCLHGELEVLAGRLRKHRLCLSLGELLEVAIQITEAIELDDRLVATAQHLVGLILRFQRLFVSGDGVRARVVADIAKRVT